MNTVPRTTALLAIMIGLAGCEVFQDPTPEFLFFQMDGSAGDVVEVIYSKQFVVGVNENGITRVQIFGADTVTQVMPIDTVIDVRLERQLFIQVETTPADTLGVSVRIDIDGRSIFSGAGDVFPELPWRYLYMFNIPFTSDIDVVF